MAKAIDLMRSFLVFVHDIVVALLAWLCAYWLRFNLDIPADFQHAMLDALLVVIPVQAAVFYGFGLYRGIWRFASVADLKRLLIGVGMAALVTATALVLTQKLQWVPRSVLIMDPLLLILFMGGARFGYRAWKDGQFFLRRSGIGTSVVIVGAGEAAANLLKELERSQVWQVVGIIDEHEGSSGKRLAGVPVLGGLDSIDEHVKRWQLRHAIIAMPTASVAERRRVTERVSAAGLIVFTVPALDDLLSGRVSVSSVRKVELEDILGRDPVLLDEDGLSSWLGGKAVLVTGAGGSIGAELCRQILRFQPRLLVLFEVSEFALYSLEQEFARDKCASEIRYLIGDVKDDARLETIFSKYRPDVVFHAAAYKHVPLMESANAWEAVRNNVAGTLCVARMAARFAAAEFVLISTDKAVNPTNVMGATKRLAEMVCQAMQACAPTTRFAVVRFGNVLGSSGSVIPKFREQIARGGPVTVTHPEIIRYFMLIPEAAQLVLQAGLMANSADEGGRIFVLDMGEPVKIADLARDMIRLSGFREDDILIEYTGLRPGEKLYEELLADDESSLPTPHPKLRIARTDFLAGASWLDEMETWLGQESCADVAVKKGLQARVLEYAPQGLDVSA